MDSVECVFLIIMHTPKVVEFRVSSLFAQISDIAWRLESGVTLAPVMRITSIQFHRDLAGNFR